MPPLSCLWFPWRSASSARRSGSRAAGRTTAEARRAAPGWSFPTEGSRNRSERRIFPCMWSLEQRGRVRYISNWKWSGNVLLCDAERWKQKDEGTHRFKGHGQPADFASVHPHRCVGQLPREQVGFRERVTLRMEQRQNRWQFVPWREQRADVLQPFILYLWIFIWIFYTGRS